MLFKIVFFFSSRRRHTRCSRDWSSDVCSSYLDGLEGARTVEEIAAGAAGALWKLIERDERLPRVYFDLNAVSVVDARSEERRVGKECRCPWSAEDYKTNSLHMAIVSLIVRTQV